MESSFQKEINNFLEQGGKIKKFDSRLSESNFSHSWDNTVKLERQKFHFSVSDNSLQMERSLNSVYSF